MEESHFLAIISRMKYIERWALMRSSRPENLSEHSLEVALIAHMLCTIGNVRHGRRLDADRAAVVATPTARSSRPPSGACSTPSPTTFATSTRKSSGSARTPTSPSCCCAAW